MPESDDWEGDLGTAFAAAGVVGVWKYRAEDRTVFCDASMAKFFGVDPIAAKKGVPLYSLRQAINPMDVPRADANLDQSVRTGQRYNALYRVGKNVVRSTGCPHKTVNQGTLVHGVNFLANEPPERAIHSLADRALDVVALAREDGDELTIHLAEMLLVHIGQRLSGRLTDEL